MNRVFRLGSLMACCIVSACANSVIKPHNVIPSYYTSVEEEDRDVCLGYGFKDGSEAYHKCLFARYNMHMADMQAARVPSCARSQLGLHSRVQCPQ